MLRHRINNPAFLLEAKMNMIDEYCDLQLDLRQYFKSIRQETSNNVTHCTSQVEA